MDTKPDEVQESWGSDASSSSNGSPSGGASSSTAASPDGSPQPSEGGPPPRPAGPQAAGPAGSTPSGARPGPATAASNPAAGPGAGPEEPVESEAAPLAETGEAAASSDGSGAGEGSSAVEESVLAALAEAPVPAVTAGDARPAVVPLLEKVVEMGGSDLHLKPMRPPLVRLHGNLTPLETEPLSPERLESMLQEMLVERQAKELADKLQVDFGYSVAGLSRFRATVFYQRSTLAAVFRRIPFEFPSIEDWGLPPVLNELAGLQRGLILVTGPTGAGKSSTLASMIRRLADTRRAHIVCIEDPIEFLLRDSEAAITQREVGTDCLSFDMGLRNALRQDPDVIMVGEMRDRETVRTVLTAAETGHLVLSTLHTNSASQTIDRILDLFPGPGQSQIRTQLAHVLEAIISLQLVPRADGEGLTAAVEVLRASERIRKMLEDGQVADLTGEMEKSVLVHQMQSMNQSLAALVLTGTIDRDVAEAHAHNRGDFDLLLRSHLPEGQEGDDDMEPYCDYSRILEIDELRKLRDDAEERQASAAQEHTQELTRLREALQEREQELDKLRATLARGKEEFKKMRDQLEFLKGDYETRIKKLQDRVRTLTRERAQNS